MNEATADSRSKMALRIRIVLYCIVLLVIAAYLMHPFYRSHTNGHGPLCRINLKQMPILFTMYAGEHNGEYPSMTPTPGCFTFNFDQTYPDYINDLTILVCPQDQVYKFSLPDDFFRNPKYVRDRNSYFYLGYVLLNAEEGQAFIKTCIQRLAANEWLSGELPAPEGKGSGGGNVFLPFAQNVVERLPISTDGIKIAEAQIPLMCEKLGHHAEGVNVVYMDGHVEMVAVDSKWPADKTFLKALEALETLAAR